MWKDSSYIIYKKTWNTWTKYLDQD
jgi:hypothetical protein